MLTLGALASPPFASFGPVWPTLADALLDLIALTGPALDLARRRRVHPACS